MTEQKIEINLDEMTNYMDELKKAKAKTEFDLKQINAEIEKQEKILEALLEQTGVNEMTHGIYSFGWKITQRKSFDQTKFKSENPDLYEKYKIQKESKSFEFKIG